MSKYRNKCVTSAMAVMLSVMMTGCNGADKGTTDIVNVGTISMQQSETKEVKEPLDNYENVIISDDVMAVDNGSDEEAFDDNNSSTSVKYDSDSNNNADVSETTHFEENKAKETSAAKEAATKPYIVGTDVKRVVNSSEVIKYGATRKNITEYTYEIYSDESRKEVAKNNKTVIDRSTYCATDDTLMVEAESNVESYRGLFSELLIIINEFRQDNGIEPVVLDKNLCRAACMRAVEIDYAAYFNHTRPDGRNAFTALDYYSCIADFRGENLAGGQRTSEQVVKAWEESDKGHRELLLNPKVKKMGCGYSYSGTIGYPVWTLEMTD